MFSLKEAISSTPRRPKSLRDNKLKRAGGELRPDAFEVEPGEQPLQAPGLPQVRRQDGRGERLPPVGGPTVTDPGLLDLDGADAGLDGPLGQVAIADDLAASLVVLVVGVI